MSRPLVLMFTLAVLVAAVCPAEARSKNPRVFRYRQADKARDLARRENKPLVIHLIPSNANGAKQIRKFYESRGGIPRQVLDRVVVLLLPQEKFAAFAAKLGIQQVGGMRTISPYDLSMYGYSALETQKVTRDASRVLKYTTGFR